MGFFWNPIVLADPLANISVVTSHHYVEVDSLGDLEVEGIEPSCQVIAN